MKKSLLLGLGAVAMTFGAVSILVEKQAVETRANYNVTISSVLTPNETTMRYWFVNNTDGFHGGSGAKMGIHAWKEGGTNQYFLMTSYQNGSGTGQFFYYVDVPTDAEKFQIIRFASSATVGINQTVWNDSGDYMFSSYKPYYLHVCGGSMGLSSLTNEAAGSSGTSKIEAPSAYTLSKVLEGYVVCSSSELNGYGAASYLWTNWVNPYKTEGAGINGKWDEVTLQDYAQGSYSGNNDSYSGLSRDTNFTVKEKWEGLANQANIDPTSGVAKAKAVLSPIVGNNGNDILVMGSISLVGLISIGGFFFVRKMRRD